MIEDWVWIVKYVPDDPECAHELPNDWQFGGATGEDPRADPRWMPTTYLFMDRGLVGRHHTTEPRCDHEARGWYRERTTERLPKEWEIFFILATPPGADKPTPIYTRYREAVSGAS